MRKFLIIYLVITGILASMALAMPGLVVIGMFFFVPGIILVVAPTAFLWGGVFSILYFPVSFFLRPRLARGLALVATVAVLCLIPFPSVFSAYTLNSRYKLENVEPASPVRPYGDIRLDLESARFESGNPNAPGYSGMRCDDRCLALLFEPEVKSVTVTSTETTTFVDVENGKSELVEGARSYRLLPKGLCKEPYAEPDLSRSDGSFGETTEDRQAIVATWRLKFLTEVCLAKEAPIARYDMLLRTASWASENQSKGADSPWGAPQSVVSVSTAELRDAQGKALFRHADVSTPALFMPLFIAPMGNIEHFHFGWGRQYWPLGSRQYWSDQIYLVDKVLQVQRKLDPASGLQSARQAVRFALENASTPEPKLEEFTQGYMRLLVNARPTPEDLALVKGVMQDMRLSDFPGAAFLPDSLTASQLNDLLPLAIRKLSMRTNTQKTGPSALGVALEKWPESAFANPDQATLSLLAEPELRFRAPGLTARLSDMGAHGGPILADILEWHLEATASKLRGERRLPAELYSGESSTIPAAIKAMCQLGPLANAQLPRMVKLENQYRYAIDHFVRMDWDRMMVSLGKPIADVAVPNRYPESYRSDLEKWKNAFDPKRSC